MRCSGQKTQGLILAFFFVRRQNPDGIDLRQQHDLFLVKTLAHPRILMKRNI